MPTRLVDILGSYNLFAKSMPGILLLLGLSTLLPSGANLGFKIQSSFANFAALIISAVLLGFLLGEGVHIFGDTIERVVYWVGDWILRNVFRPLKVSWDNFIERIDTHVISFDDLRDQWQAGQDSVDKAKESFICKWLIWIVGWIPRRIAEFFRGLISLIREGVWRLHSTFKQHRRLWANSIEWNYTPDGDGRWEEREKGELYDRFARCFEKKFLIDIRTDPDPDELMQYYPWMTSQLSIEDTTRAGRLQATYSFCRSMWVSFSLLFVGYIVILWPILQGGDEPLYQAAGLGLIASEGLPVEDPVAFYPVILIPLAITVLVFLIGVGKYKRHYVEYLMADFCTSQTDPGPSATRQTTLQDQDNVNNTNVTD